MESQECTSTKSWLCNCHCSIQATKISFAPALMTSHFPASTSHRRIIEDSIFASFIAFADKEWLELAQNNCSKAASHQCLKVQLHANAVHHNGHDTRKLWSCMQ